MDGEGLPRAGCETVPGVLGSCSDRPRAVTDSLGLQASFSQLQVAVFERHLARRLCFHIFNFHQLSVFEGRLARKLRFHNFNYCGRS